VIQQDGWPESEAQALQHHGRPERPCHLRHQQRRHLRLDRGVGTARSIPKNRQSRGQLHEHSRGNKYPDLIRAADPKPIRVFVQDGASDNRSRRPGWNWVIGNLNLVAALEDKDYDYKYVFGEGVHNGNHGGTIFPDTIRWLWRDYPKRVREVCVSPRWFTL